MKLIFSLSIAINFLIMGEAAWGDKTSDRVAYLKSRIENLESQPGMLKEIQALQRELDDLQHTPKMPKVDLHTDTPFIDGGQKNTTPKTYTPNPGNIDFFHENTNLVAVDYGIPKEVVERAKSQMHSGSTQGALSQHAAEEIDAVHGVPDPTTGLSSRDEIRKKREDIHATRGIMGKGLKIPKKFSGLKPIGSDASEQRQQVEKPMHGRPVTTAQQKAANVGPAIGSILPVHTPKPPVSNISTQKNNWGFCSNDVPYLQEQLEIKISQLAEAQEKIKRTKDGFEVQKLANQIQQLENDKQYYIKMIQSLGGTPKVRMPQRKMMKAMVPTQSQEYQIKSSLEQLDQAEKMVRHRIRITKDPKALSALGASLENIQNQKKLLEASAKDTGAMDKTEVYSSPKVFTSQAPENNSQVKQDPSVQNDPPVLPQAQDPIPNGEGPRNNWTAMARQVTNPSDVAEYVEDDDVIRSAPKKPLWADSRESSVRDERSIRTQKRGRALSQSEAKQIARAWLSR